jgi:hypothetical protein
MTRRLLNLLTLLSLLVCVGSIALWLRSLDQWTDRIERCEKRRGWGLYLARGRVSYRWFRDENSVLDPVPLWHERRRTTKDLHAPLPNPDVGITLAGHHYSHTRLGPVYDYWLVVVPLWTPTALFAILPLAAGASCWKRQARQIHRVEGRCPTCGYDLRATPDRCPECGHSPAEAGKRVRSALSRPCLG